MTSSLTLATSLHDHKTQQIITNVQRISDLSPKTTRQEQFDLVYRQLWYLEENDLKQRIISPDSNLCEIPVINCVGFVQLHETESEITLALHTVTASLNASTSSLTGSSTTSSTNMSLKNSILANNTIHYSVAAKISTIHYQNHKTSVDKLNFHRIDLVNQLLSKFKHNSLVQPQLLLITMNISKHLDTSKPLQTSAITQFPSFVGVIFDLPSAHIQITNSNVEFHARHCINQKTLTLNADSLLQMYKLV